MADETNSRILRAKESFTVPGPHDVTVGDLVHADDPIVTGREHLFEPIETRVRAAVPGTPVSPPPFLEPDGGQQAGDGEGEAGDGDSSTGGGKRTRKASGGA